MPEILGGQVQVLGRDHSVDRIQGKEGLAVVRHGTVDPFFVRVSDESVQNRPEIPDCDRPDGRRRGRRAAGALLDEPADVALGRRCIYQESTALIDGRVSRGGDDMEVGSSVRRQESGCPRGVLG